MAVSDNINDHFFKSIYKDVWRKLIPADTSQAECEFLAEEAELKSGDRVLDLMCGYGRHAVPLAKKGFQVTAIDNSEDYITEIQTVASEANLPIETQLETALQAQLHHQYELVICMGNSFAFFNKEDVKKLLQKISSHLSPNGLLVINTWMIAEVAIRNFKQREWISVDKYKYLLRYDFKFFPHRIESEHTIIDDNSYVEIINGVDFIFSLAELEIMFNEAGLQIKTVYGTLKKRPFKMGDNTAYIIIEKMIKN